MTPVAKPVYLVDMDGVLVDFDAWIYERRDLWPSLNPDRSQQRAYFLTDEVSKTDAVKMRETVNAGRVFRDAPPLPGAIAGVWALAEEADVWICTKPLEANAHCRDDKAAWLRKHLGPEFENKLIIAPNKGLVHGAVLLDDHPKKAHIEIATWKPVIYNQPFNQWQGGESEFDAYPHYSWDMPLEDLLRWADPAEWG